MNEKSAKLEKKVVVSVPQNFYKDLSCKFLQSSAHVQSEEGGTVCKPIIAIMQQDSAIAY
eukprot:15365359-Ditylum_brightwellii.AAC.2